MSAAGALLGAFAACGLLLVMARVRAIRRAPLEMRVLPYLRDLPGALPQVRSAGRSWGLVRLSATALGRLLGGDETLRRRLLRAGLPDDVDGYRAEQVLWGVIGLVVAAVVMLGRAARGADRSGSSIVAVVVCVAAFAAGVMCRDSRLTSQVTRRERRIITEFPSLAELLALSVTAGESPVSALDRVVARSNGPLSEELGRVLADIRTGETVTTAFDRLASRTGLPLLARFSAGLATAVERGTPLADVLHAQAADVREAGRRELIEAGARREVFMMAPVVFLVLPVVVLFALYPGLLSLHLDT